MSEKDLEQLRKDTESGSKLDETEAEQEFVDTLADTLDTIENARSHTVTANDPELWALFEALNRDDDRRKEFCEAVGIEHDERALNRSGAVRELVRAGVREMDSELAAEMNEAISKNQSTTW